VRVAEPFRSGKRVRARITARQALSRKERGTPSAALRSGALTGRAHGRKKALPLCSECLSMPQPGARRRNAYGLRKISASTGSIKHLKADEPLAKSCANSGAHPPEKGTRFPLAFLGVQGDGWLLLWPPFLALRQSLL